MEIKLLLLDFDGTVANTGRANATSYIEALAEEGITITMEEYRKRYFGLRCPEFLADIGITDPVQMKRIRERKVAIYPTHFDMVTLNKPLWDFVQQFRANGGKAMIVSTGHISNITNAMKYLGIENQIDGLLSSDDVAISKPAPDCFIKALEMAGVTAAQTIIFEDSEIGLAAAEASGAAYFKVVLDF